MDVQGTRLASLDAGNGKDKQDSFNAFVNRELKESVGWRSSVPVNLYVAVIERQLFGARARASAFSLLSFS